MGSRGRPSLAALAIAPTPREVARIAEPPDILGEREACIWRMVMATRAADMIGVEAFPLLVEYCRSVVSSNAIAESLEEIDDHAKKSVTGLMRWDKLLLMQERETRKISSLAVKLRLTPSTRVLPDKAGSLGQLPANGERNRPWEDEEND